MLRILILCSVLSIIQLMEVDGIRVSSRWANGLKRIQNNILKRANPFRMLITASSVTSVYVGGTGIWWRSGVIASISQMEQGEKEKSMQTLHIAMTTLAVFDTTQATVSPIASELISQLVSHRGFRQTVAGFKEYNRVVTEAVIGGNANDVDDIIDNAKALRKRIGNFFDNEVTSFLKNTQGYDDLVTSLNNAKRWAKGLTWFDTISGPFFDAANVAFCGWQLYNAIHDEDSPPEVRSLNIASASLGVASGAVGVTSFVVGALATAGSVVATVAGPVGAIVGCVLSLASIIIDLINSANPYGTIKDHLETIQKLKKGSLQYLQNQVNITRQITPVFKQNTGFDTIYEINQGNLIEANRPGLPSLWSGVDRDPNIIFDARNSPGNESGYLTMGKKRIFDKSKYPQNFFFRPQGLVPLGYDFYGNVTKPNGKGVTVVVNTAMVAEHFWIRGVHIDTRVENDEEEGNPDDVVIGEMTGLALSGHSIQVNTGAGDDLLQVTGLLCNAWTYHEMCFRCELGTGINTLSFQGMNTDRVRFPDSRGSKIFVGIKYSMTGFHWIHLRMKDSERSPVQEYHFGYVADVNVFHGSPFDDEIVMGEDRSCVVKNDGGNNNYVIYLSNERSFTHTIIDDSETLGQIFLVRKKEGGGFKNHDIRDVVYDKETQTLVTFMRDSEGRHTFTGRIIIKRTKPGDVKEMKLHLVQTYYFRGCPQVPSLDEERLDCHSYSTLGHQNINRGIGSLHRFNRFFGWNIDDRPVPSVPFHYDLNTDLEANPIPGLCGDFIISLGPFKGTRPQRGGSHEFSLRLPQNSFITISDYLLGYVTARQPFYVLYYLKSDRKLVFEHRFGYLIKAHYTINVNVPEAKRIVFRTTGNYQLLLDLKHDDRPAVNLASEYEGLVSRPIDEYRFTKNYVNESSKPKQLVLGVPAKTPTETIWKITFGQAKTYAQVTLEERPWISREGVTTGDYAENALIVSDILWAHLSREQNDMRIIFKPSNRNRNQWRIIVEKGGQKIHEALVTGANTLAYHEGSVRSNLYDLVNGEKRQFNLKNVWRPKMDILQSDIIAEANRCR